MIALYWLHFIFILALLAAAGALVWLGRVHDGE